MLSTPAHPQSRFFFDLLADAADHPSNSKFKLNREALLPEIADHHVIGSSQGFLITAEVFLSNSARIHATDPLTGATLPLPSAPSLALSHLRYLHFPCNNGKFVLRDPPTTDAEPLLLDEHFRKLHDTGKAILSPSLASVVVTVSSFPPLHARVGEDATWAASPPHPFLVSAAKEDWRGPDDCIFHKGLLHVLWGEALIVVDTDDPWKPAKVSSVRHPHVFCNCHLSLVESPDRDDLFLVCRVLNDEYPRSHYTKGFKVYKLHQSEEEEKEGGKYIWEEVECMGEDVAVVVSHSATTTFSVVKGCSNFRPNCIYFANEVNRVDGMMFWNP